MTGGRIAGAGRQASAPKLGRLWAVRGRSTVTKDDQRRPLGTRAHRSWPAKTQLTKIPGKTQGKKK